MQFKIEDKALHVTAETPREVLEMVKHYRLDVLEHADALASGHLVHVCPPGKDGGEWFAVSSQLGPEWLAPYMARIQHLTGYTGHLADMPGPRYPAGYADNLCHTHIVQTATVSSVGAHFHGFIHSGDWNGKTAAQRYQAYFDECVRAGMGDTKQEREFLEVGNGGLLKRNPNYMRRHAPNAAAASAAVLECLLQHWLDRYATPGQRDIIARCMANHRTVCKNDGMGAYFLRMYDQGYRVGWDLPLVSFDEFKGA